MQRGDVWWFETPTTSRRPCVVMTRSAAIEVLNRVVVIPLTRTVRGIPTEVVLDQSDGLHDTCVASTDNVETVSKALLTRPITTLSQVRMHQICQALHIAIDC